jgi:hypothetical protein
LGVIPLQAIANALLNPGYLRPLNGRQPRFKFGL